jgi:Fe-S-cluster containining protein
VKKDLNIKANAAIGSAWLAAGQPMETGPDLVCGTCRHCCRNNFIKLVPEAGDPAPEVYGFENVHLRKDALTGDRAWFLKERPIPGSKDTECVFLGPDGCTIYDKRPIACRVFDCREVYKALKRRLKPVELKQVFRREIINRDVYDAGKARVEDG